MPGKYFEDLEIGDHLRHPLGRTVTEADNLLFCALTMNTQPLHLDAEFAAKSVFGQRVVNGIFTMGLVVGMTISDLTEGTIVANLGYEDVRHPLPVFLGDTLRVETEVLEKRRSQSRPDRGIIKVRHHGLNQRDEVVVEVTRSVMFLCRGTAG